MMLISFLFIPNVLCSLWVAFSIVSIELGVVGYMALWNVNLDSISMVNLIMCIGFSVDFTAHICYAYMSSKALSPKERVRESLYALGLPIIQGAISTILGVAALILAGSYIFMVFFKMIFLVIVFGALHGMFLLPVLLSLFGPGACTSDKKRHSSIDKSLPHPYSIPHPSLHQDFNKTKPYRGVSAMVVPKFNSNARLDKDMGLGTSEDSSESSSSRSQRKRKEAAEDEAQRRKYMEGWRKATGHSMMPPWRTGYPNNIYSSDDDRKRAYVSESHNRPTRPGYYDEQPHRNNGRYH